MSLNKRTQMYCHHKQKIDAILTFSLVSVVSNMILSLSIVTKVPAVLSPELKTREDFLQCEFDTNTFHTVYFIPNHKSSFSSNHMVLHV